jgi:hypothetical protein
MIDINIMKTFKDDFCLLYKDFLIFSVIHHVSIIFLSQESQPIMIFTNIFYG